MPMSDSYKKRLSHVLPQIVKKFGTPFHIYDEKGIKDTCRTLTTTFEDILAWMHPCQHLCGRDGHLRPKELLLREDSSVELIRRAETLDDYFSTLAFEPKTLTFKEI